jgi:hypothetical protein
VYVPLLRELNRGKGTNETALSLGYAREAQEGLKP